MKERKDLWARILAILLTLTAASALCLSLYHFDNKYTRPGAQPLDGLLILSQDEMDAYDTHFLIHGWAFYPDALLTPADLVENRAKQYMVYTSIGEHTKFDFGGRDDPHGCGTYALTLQLPDEPASYALELPEIYSAYKLYINDQLKLQTGDPQKKTYLPQTQNRVVVFEASGTVRLLLAVSDYSHFYGGLVYPPAFGSPQDINLMCGIRMALAVCTCLLGLLGTLFSCYLGFRMKHRNALLFSLLCLTTALFTCYPLLHTALPLPVHPWYALESACGYIVIFLVMALQNRLCRVEVPVRYCSEATGILFCIAVLCYGLFSAHLTVPVMEAFSYAALLFKAGAALYLLTVSLWSLRLQETRTMPLLCASVFYDVMLLWDRLLPAYEPVLTGWFAEWGCLVMILIIGYTLWSDIVTAYSYNLAFAEEYRQTKRQLAMQMEYANQIAERSSENRRLIHDFRHHLRAIREMAYLVSSEPETKERQKELLSYLETFPQTSDFQTSLSPNVLCNHAAVDALLQYFDAAALRQDIGATLALTIPDELPLSDIEWCTVLGNLLENALEACQCCRNSDEAHQLHEKDEARPFLRIAAKWTGQMFFLIVENTYDGDFRQKNGKFLSHKRSENGFGLGLESVRETVERHGGNMDVYPLEKIFRVGILLPGNRRSYEKVQDH